MKMPRTGTKRGDQLKTVHRTKPRGEDTHSQFLEEPPVLASKVTILQQFPDRLLRVLPLRRILEGLRCDSSLQALQLKGVSCWEKVAVVHNLKRKAEEGQRTSQDRGYQCAAMSRRPGRHDEWSGPITEFRRCRYRVRMHQEAGERILALTNGFTRLLFLIFLSFIARVTFKG